MGASDLRMAAWLTWLGRWYLPILLGALVLAVVYRVQTDTTSRKPAPAPKEAAVRLPLSALTPKQAAEVLKAAMRDELRNPGYILKALEERPEVSTGLLRWKGWTCYLEADLENRTFVYLMQQAGFVRRVTGAFEVGSDGRWKARVTHHTWSCGIDG